MFDIRLLSSMGLWIFQHERVSSLSGGVRRRVSVSIAFVAGSRTQSYLMNQHQVLIHVHEEVFGKLYSNIELEEQFY